VYHRGIGAGQRTTSQWDNRTTGGRANKMTRNEKARHWSDRTTRRRNNKTAGRDVEGEDGDQASANDKNGEGMMTTTTAGGETMSKGHDEGNGDMGTRGRQGRRRRLETGLCELFFSNFIYLLLTTKRFRS
jgi:hypothetical protein